MALLGYSVRPTSARKKSSIRKPLPKLFFGCMTDVFTLKWSFGGPQHVRSYTAWPNRAKETFCSVFAVFGKKYALTQPAFPKNSAFLCSYFSFHLLYLKGKVFYD
jgi:hypothetical protein